MRTIDRMWPLNVDRDWATDCSSPMSAVDVVEDRQPGSCVGGNVQARLMHQAQQAERPQRHGLAASDRL